MGSVDVQLKGFPLWTEQEDLKYTIDETGYHPSSLRINWTNPEVPMAEAAFSTWEAADEVVYKLHKFEFTPGYPLLARISPGQTRPAAGSAGWKGAPGKGGVGAASGQGGKGGLAPQVGHSGKVDTRTQELPPASETESSVRNCIGAGRIEGWFLNSRSGVLQKGWGHVQSYCFEGNLVYRPVNSPLLKDTFFAQKDIVSFEVMMVKGQCEAVRLATPEMEGVEPISHPPLNLDSSDMDGFQEYQKVVEQRDVEEIPASMKSQKRRQREEADTRCMFFGGFGPEISEATLTKFAEQAGKVTKCKIFLHTGSWESKGCGKIQYYDQESADRATNELSGTVLNNRIVTCEPLGQSSNTNPNPKKRKPEPPKQRDDFTDDMPKQLPLSLFNAGDGPKQKLEICYAAFEDLLKNHNPDITGVSMILMIRKLVMEVNDIFGDDEESLQTWCQHLRTFPWFRDNMQIVKWQANKKRVNISKVSANQPMYISKAQTIQLQVDQRKKEQEMMGKSLFEVPEEEKAATKAFPVWTQKGGFGTQGGPLSGGQLYG